MAKLFTEVENQIEATQSIADRFKYWKEAQAADTNWKSNVPMVGGEMPVEGFKKSFCIDGVSSVDGHYSGVERSKVLFVLKESNIGREEFQHDGKTHIFWFDEEPLHSTRIKYMKNFQMALDKFFPEWDSTMSIGYMNLNKRGGASYTESKRLKAYIRDYHKFILKEIEIIAPEMIFLCGCNDVFISGIREASLQNEPFRDEGDVLKLIVSENVSPQIVTIYHPSYPRFKDCLN